MHCIVGLFYENDLRIMRRISWMEDWQIKGD